MDRAGVSPRSHIRRETETDNSRLWYWQSFSIKVVWFSTIFASIGGGSAMTTTFLFVVLSDITPEAKRANAFLRAGAINMLAQLVMPPLAAWLMRYSPWYVQLHGNISRTRR